jgi:hypothetical protein
MLDRVTDGAAGDLVERHPMHGDALQCASLLQHGANVPADRLALAVGVGREIKGLGALQRLGDGCDLTRAALVGRPVHRKVFVGSDAAVLGRQVADVAEAREHGEVVAKILVDRLGLGGRFYD